MLALQPPEYGPLPYQIVALNPTADDVGFGSWPCKNAKTLIRDRRNYSSKTVFVARLASEFKLEVELKNIILVAFRFFEFLHSQLGSKAALTASKSDFRFAPDNGLKSDIA